MESQKNKNLACQSTSLLVQFKSIIGINLILLVNLQNGF